VHTTTSPLGQKRFSPSFLPLELYSFGVGDRFAQQAKAQLQAIMLASANGVQITPVWNKSYREHSIIGSEPASVLSAARDAARALNWTKPFHIDADHVTLETVKGFVASSDYYTLDVADGIGKPAPRAEVESFLAKHPELLRPIDLPHQSLTMSRETAFRVATKYLLAAAAAGEVYRRVAEARGSAAFVTEVSMDETDSPQEPEELLLILAALADEEVPVQAIAPKFIGRFNKGVDYSGDPQKFEAQFCADIAIIEQASKLYDLPKTLKLSVHSGSDKFSLYAPIRRSLRKTGAGLHLKTAGTTWLEELIGLSEAGGDALAMAKEIYSEAYVRREELCAPYLTVIDIDPGQLPAPQDVNQWSSTQYASALRHDQSCPEFNQHFRQLLHVGYRIAAEFGEKYLELLRACQKEISRNVITNLFERHLKPLFLEQEVTAGRG
jgi:hypothetical protein